MTSPAALQSPDNQPASAGSEMAPYAAMMGVGQQGSSTNSAEMMRKMQIENAGAQVRSLGEALDGLAKQFPGAAQQILALKQGLTQVLVKIVGSSNPESQPSTGAM